MENWNDNIRTDLTYTGRYELIFLVLAFINAIFNIILTSVYSFN